MHSYSEEIHLNPCVISGQELLVGSRSDWETRDGLFKIPCI